MRVLRACVCCVVCYVCMCVVGAAGWSCWRPAGIREVAFWQQLLIACPAGNWQESLDGSSGRVQASFGC